MSRAFALGFLLVLPICSALDANLAGPAAADRIEEDWELVIATPDPAVTCPQITTTMMPDASDPTTVLSFNLNYREAPTFYAGGVQVKILNGDWVLAAADQGSAQFATNNELVTWTQRMSLAGGMVRFKVASGSSTTWGNFGVADSDLAVSVATSLASLANYSPDSSARKSGPGFGSNRVGRMTLLRVRYYQNGALISTDATNRPVDLSY